MRATPKRGWWGRLLLLAALVILAGVGWLMNGMANRYLTGTRQVPGVDWFGNPVPQSGPPPGYVWLGWTRRGEQTAGLELEEPSEDGKHYGLQAGDVLETVDGHPLTSSAGLFKHFMTSCQAGKQASFRIRRGASTFDVSVALLPWLRTPADIGARYEDVTIESRGGLKLRGWFIPPPPGSDGRAGVFAHGAKASRFQGLRMAEHWLRHGFGLLLVDFSGRGSSDGQYVTYGMNERYDLDAMMAWLRARPEVDPKKAVYFGTSNGAAATLLAAADDPNPVAVALDAPFADLGTVARETLARSGYPKFLIYPLELAVWIKSGLRVSKLRPVEAAVRVRCPVFITHGTADVSVPPHHTRELVAARQAAELPTQVWWLPGGEHGFDNYPPMDAYWDRILEFYESVIGPRSPS